MQNKTLAITKNCIPYFKELRTLTGSVTATILMQQLDYWFSKKQGEPFYKFKAPCENQYYKNGDSFTEELGFSIEEFTNAFAKIGIAYKSKTEFDNTDDKFKGMFYCSYFDRKEGLTFYYRNHLLLDKKLNELFTANGESQFTENNKVNLHKTAKSISPIYITENNNKRIQQDNKEKNIKKENVYPEKFIEFFKIYEEPKKQIDLQSERLKKIYNKWKSCEDPDKLIESAKKYIEYLQYATWRKKKDIIAWLNAAFYKEDWQEEINKAKQKLTPKQYNKQTEEDLMHEAIYKQAQEFEKMFSTDENEKKSKRIKDVDDFDEIDYKDAPF